MSYGLTKTGFSLYSLLYLKFKVSPFNLDSVRWYFSKPMLKKLVFQLVSAGWVQSVERGTYRCVQPEIAIAGLFSPRIEPVLKESNVTYSFTGASAAEIWSDGSYIQRSWEYTPFFVKVLKSDLKQWTRWLNSKGVSFFIKTPKNVVGAFLVLTQVSSLKPSFHNGKPVDSLGETIEFCESNRGSFEYVLAYIQNKYHQQTTASEEFLAKAREAL